MRTVSFADDCALSLNEQLDLIAIGEEVECFLLSPELFALWLRYADMPRDLCLIGIAKTQTGVPVIRGTVMVTGVRGVFLDPTITSQVRTYCEYELAAR